jgi:serine/threonine protein kinase
MGTDTLGRFEIIDKLGEGGMGLLYRARDPRLGRTVAIKLLRPDSAADPQRTRRLLQEARTLSTVDQAGRGRLPPVFQGVQCVVLACLTRTMRSDADWAS